MQLGLDIAPYVGVNKRSRSVAQPGSASGLGPEGREFESLHSDHFPFKYNSGRSHAVFTVGLACFIVAMAFTSRLLAVGNCMFQNPALQRSALPNAGEYGF